MKKFEEIKQKVSNDIWIAKEKTKNFAIDTLNFVVDNKEAIAFVTPVVLGAAKGTKAVVRSIDRKREENWKYKHIYDRSLGKHIELKRKLTPNECIEIERRRANGEKLCTILSSMRLMK